MVVGLTNKRLGEVTMVTFVNGRSGSGKTHYMFEQIASILSQNKQAQIFIVAPDQMSFQMEYELLNRLSTQAMAGVQVVGLSRLVTQLLNIYKPLVYQKLDVLAQKILLQQVAFTLEEQLAIYKTAIKKPEFINFVHKFMQEMNGATITITEILANINKASQPLLYDKITEIGGIVADYHIQKQTDIFDSSDQYKQFINLLTIPKMQAILANVYVFIDGYYTFNQQEFTIISGIMRYAKSAMITFCLTRQVDAPNLFEVVKKQYQIFLQEFPTAEIIELIGENQRFINNAILAQIEANYNNPITLAVPVVDASIIAVRIFEHRQAEITHVAKKIRQQLLSQEIRAQEIAVFVPSISQYISDIEYIFAQYDIPYYLDIKEKMLVHPVMSWLHLLTTITANNWQVDKIISLVQNPFFCWQNNISKADLYLFLTQMEQIKIPYKSIWQNDNYWKYYDNPQILNSTENNEKTVRIKEVRRKIFEHITSFELLINKKYQNTTECLSKHFEFIRNLNVLTYLEEMDIPQSSYTKHLTKQQYRTAVWKMLVHIFEQINLAIGHLPYNQESYLFAFILGLEEAEFSGVPNGFDAVMVGDFERSRFQTLHQEAIETKMGVQYGYILGMIDKFVPHGEARNGILSDSEIIYLQKNNQFQDVLVQEQAMSYQLFRFYTMFTSIAKSVQLSYYLKDGIYLDEVCYPSTILEQFGNKGFNVPFIIEKTNDLENYQYMTPRALTQQLAQIYHQQTLEKQILQQIVAQLDNCFIASLQNATNYNNKIILATEVPIPENISMTQIETFNNCPYQYFLKYVLRLKEQYSGNFEPFQSGTIVHSGMEEIVKTAIVNQNKLSDISLENQYNILTNYFEQMREKMQKLPLFRQYINHFLFDNLKKMVTEKLEYINENEAMSDFYPKYTEVELPALTVELPNTTKRIIGKVDRLDINSDNNLFRIVDYKSSRKTIDFDRLLDGVQLQLPLYSYLAAQKHENLQFSGSMYVMIDDKYIRFEDAKANLQDLLQQTIRATGFFLNDNKSLEAFDTRLENDNKSRSISYERTKNGTPTVHSMVMEADEIEMMQEYVVKKAIETVTKIVKNEFSITPRREQYDMDTTPCKYCQFRRICQFDEKLNCYREVKKIANATNFKAKKEQFLTSVKTKFEESE